jgi:hypothetical protein
LSALTASVEPFERNEFATLRMGGHGKHHSKAARGLVT